MPTETGGEQTETPNTSQPNQAELDGRTAAGSTAQRPRKDPVLTERERMLNELDAKIVAQRIKDDETFLRSEDPRAIALAARMRAEASGRDPESATAGSDEPAGESEGVTDVTPITPDPDEDEAARAATAATQVDPETGADPLAEWIVQRNGKPMFRTVVDGREQLVPLDRARAELQKRLAGDARLQQANERQRQLDAREAQIRQNEAALRARVQRPQPAPAAAVDDEALDKEGLELVRSLMSDPEAVAAKKMASVLKKVRQAATPPVDPEAIVRQAASVAVQTVAAQDNAKALNRGLQKFNEDFKDIAADPDLFAMADRRTNAIAEEHKDWTPEQVMLEAGRQTREWMKAHGMKTTPTPAASPNPGGNRQQRKEGLVPMPAARPARPAATTGADAEETPSQALAAMRKARGQAY